MPGWGRYSFMTLRDELMQPLCIIPTHAVALNLAQLVARFSHSRFSVMNVSTVVPVCITAFANTVAWWVTELRTSSEPLMLLRMSMSVLLLRYKNSRWIPIDVSPDRICRSLLNTAACLFSSSESTGAAGAAASFISVSPPAPSPPASADIMASPMSSVSAVAASAGAGRAFITPARKCCMSLSQRSKAIWYAMSSLVSLPERTRSARFAATLAWSSSSIKHSHTDCWSGSSSVRYSSTRHLSTLLRNCRCVTNFWHASRA
mmetsp:Transcript_34341/g.86815  ORF Transcript_34341/g.86815 Transcript_34341/m.86815 type:complete len:261 (+) Transcript_34341:1831-2613(+)